MTANFPTFTSPREGRLLFDKKYMTNEPATTCTAYHSLTSYSRQNMSGHYLDWENQPNVYKSYPDLSQILLPKEVSLPKEKLSSLIHAMPRTATPAAGVCLEDLSLILLLTYSITARTRHGLHDFFYRNVASAGALYPTELYVDSRGVSGLDDGLYHFSISDHGLSMLRKGNLSGMLSGSPGESSDSFPSLTFFLTAIFFRSSWKYRDRAYRYHLLDTGHLLENLTLALKSLNYPYHCSFDFDDTHVNRFLGLDSEMEACLAVCTVPGPDLAEKSGNVVISDLPESIKKRSRVAKNEVRYPAVLEIHRSGEKVLTSGNSGTNMPCPQIKNTPGNRAEIAKKGTWPERYNYGEAILKRRSKRNFVKKEMDADHLMALADGLYPGIPERSRDFVRDHSSICTGFICGNVSGMDAGIYLIDPQSGNFGIVKEGLFLDEMAAVCLNQAWLSNAAVHFLFLANLSAIEETWGARGYRYAMAHAGRMGERLYLMATAMDLGCCGIGAFYDQEAAELIGLDSETRLLYLVGVGPVKS